MRKDKGRLGTQEVKKDRIYCLLYGLILNSIDTLLLACRHSEETAADRLVLERNHILARRCGLLLRVLICQGPTREGYSIMEYLIRFPPNSLLDIFCHAVCCDIYV